MKKQTIISIAISFVMLFTLANFNLTSAQNTVEDQYWNMIKDSKSVDDYKGYLKEYPKGKYAPLARLKIKLNSKDKPNTNNNENFLITPNSVGDIRIGMTIAEARKIFKDAKFEQYNYSEEGIWVEVTKGEKNLMRFTTDQKNVDDEDENGKVKIDESARIDTIEFSDERYKTADGIHIGSSIKDAEKIFGNLTKIEYWGLDASEHIEFTNTPKNYSFEVSAKKGSPVEARAGIYSGDDTTTKRYNSGAYISNIQVSKPENDTTSNKDAPKFEDYPAEETYTGRKASLNLDSFGSQFKTRLSNALKDGKPTFAGKYIVADWGCGSGGCNTGAVIDAQTGRAYPFPVSLSSVTVEDANGEIQDYQEHYYRLNSRLMIFAGNLEGSAVDDGSDTIQFYEIREGKFILLKSLPYGKSQSPANYLITQNSVGDIRIGMTIADARKVFKNAKFEQYDYSEEGVWVEVTQGEKNLIRFITDQKNRTGNDTDGKVPIDESAKIETIEFSDASYKTADGIHIGSTIAEAEQRFGKVTKIELWEYDGSEHIEFANAPKSYSFTVSPKEGSAENARAGIYGKDEYSTKRYSTGAYINSMQIGKIETKPMPNQAMSYLITENSAGDIRLGMTVAQARKAMSKATFSRSSDGDGVALIAVKMGGVELMSLYAGEEDNTAPINENAKIEFIEVWDSKFKTAAGVHAKMKISDAEKKYGKVKSIMTSEIESREFAEFTTQPKRLSFRVLGPDFKAGCYEQGKSETTQYLQDSYIFSISISSPPVAAN